MFDMPEVMTIWNKIGDDGFGNIIYSLPFVVACRIAYRQSKFTDSNGDDFMSTAIFYTNSDELKIGSFVLLNVSSVELSPPALSEDVVVVTNTPSGAGPLKRGIF
jgi:hypothetical protein